MGAFALILVAGAALAAPPKPSVAFTGILARQGVTQEAADLLAQQVPEELRASGQFARIFTIEDVQRVLTLEAQKQALDCETSGCTAELAGALGADLLLSGTAGRLGTAWVLSFKLVNARTADTVASTTRDYPDAAMETLVRQVRPLVRDVLQQLQRVGWRPAAAVQATVSTPAWVMASKVGGAVFLAAGGVLLAPALAGLALAAAAALVPLVVFVPLPVERNSRDALLNGTIGVSLGAGLVATLAAAAMATAGAVLLVLPFWVNP